MTRRTNTTPTLGDVYRTDPSTSASGDVHGDHGRLSAVVELMKRAVQTLTRTTHPQRGARKLESPRNPTIGLTKAGWWTDVNQRPLPRGWLADPQKCEYVGGLPESESTELVEFWKQSVLLGRKNL